MKINGTIFSKPQQDQLKRGIGAKLDKVVAKVDDVDKRMLNYMGDWTSGNEYHEKDVVTWGTDGHLYEVIKAHTSSSTIDPSNTEYYKAMTASKIIKKSFITNNTSAIIEIKTLVKKAIDLGKVCFIKFETLSDGVPYALLTISPDGTTMQSYTAYYSTSANGLREAIFVSLANNTQKLYLRTSNLETSAISYSEVLTTTSATVIIAQ